MGNTRNVNGFTFENNYIEHPRHGFAHQSVMSFNGHQISLGVKQYQNRTWESFAYQSSMIQACKNAIEQQDSMHKEIQDTINIINKM